MTSGKIIGRREARPRPGRPAAGRACGAARGRSRCPTGTVHSAPSSERAAVRRKVRPSAPPRCSHSPRVHRASEQRRDATAPQHARGGANAERRRAAPSSRARPSAPASPPRRVGRRCARRRREPREQPPGALSSHGEQPRAPQQVEHPRASAPRRLRLLDLELLRPGQRRPPDELVDGDDHDDHGDHGAAMARTSPRSIATLMYAPMPGQAEVAVAERERLGHGQEEPAAGHRHHRVPHQPDHRRRHLERAEALPPAEAVDARRPRAARSGCARSEP